jgi:hypothetical protein
MVDVQTSLNIELFPAFILLWWWDWHNSLRYIKLQVNNKRLCSQGVLVFKWITMVTSVSQGDLWFSYNFHIDIIYLVVAIYKIRQPLNIWKYEASCLHLIELTIYLYKMYYYLFIYLCIYLSIYICTIELKLWPITVNNRVYYLFLFSRFSKDNTPLTSIYFG